MSDATGILNRIDSGDPPALEQLLPLVYEELRKLAAARMLKESLRPPSPSCGEHGDNPQEFFRLVPTRTEPSSEKTRIG